MGLDIRAYKNIKKVENAERDAFGILESDDLLEIHQDIIDYTEKEFRGRTKGLKAGVYEYKKSDGFRAGGYIGYTFFRQRLEKITSNSQLFELLMFSDCEGYIGSVVSKKLAKDFKYLEEIAKNELEERDFNLFMEFKNAFELASENGCVEFY
ncbi:hypothetical protein [Carnobacterium maltaromaticum]|uniref:hypothetical protein n=1 Tax=Carnobacterium maltaromaticum TaxID=2751 RepID=UPI00165B55B4|nr:hypothetical protein [Carnobacterium maltaromaticum]MBC9808170.1 hypothetical protein [Carnobacterium maltaromaticum]